MGVGASRWRARYHRPSPFAPCGEPTGRAASTAASRSFAGAEDHCGVFTSHGRSCRGRSRRSCVPWLYARPNRTALRVGCRDSGHGHDVRSCSSGFHIDPLAVLLGRGRDLRHCDVPNKFDSARRGATHGREHLFESRSVAARSGGMAGLVGPYLVDLEHWRRRVILDLKHYLSSRLGGNGLGLLQTHTRCSEIPVMRPAPIAVSAARSNGWDGQEPRKRVSYSSLSVTCAARSSQPLDAPARIIL
jgi:hypothetical protein